MKILVVDDNQSIAKGLATFLKQDNHEPSTAGSLQDALAILAKTRFDLVITDLKLPDGSGIEVVRKARSNEEPAEVILMTAFGSIETAVEAMKLGAIDYLTKPVPLEEFAFRIDRVEKMRTLGTRVESLKRQNEVLLEEAGFTSALDDLVGSGPEIRAIKEMIRKTAAFPSTVLLSGETGTGKEMAARAIHFLSPWAPGPFVRVNCASIPETLFESELFGHEKGAFTDARERRIGRFEAAKGGTLFLDEVGEVPLALQSKLLRALQEKEITRVGSSQPMVVEARIVSATNRNLDEMVKSGNFREDLLYRLAVIKIHLPPLRDRRSDIPDISEKLLSRLKKDLGKPRLQLSQGAMETLKCHDWPGNVRELKNTLERAIVMSSGDVIGGELVSPDHQAKARLNQEAVPQPDPPTNKGPASQKGLNETLDEIEIKMIGNAMERANGVKARAAEELKIPRTNLIYRMKRLGILEK